MASNIVGSAMVELQMDYKKNLKNAVADIQKELGKVSIGDMAKKQTQGVDELNAKIKALEDALADVNKRGGNTAKQFKSMGGELNAVALRFFSIQTAIQGVRKGISEFIRSVKEFAKFDAQLRTTSVIAGGLEENFSKLKDTMYELGKSPVTVEINKINQSMYKLASAGLDASEILETLPSAIQTSVGVGEDLDRTISLLVSTINGFNMEFRDAPQVMDLFAKAVANSQATIEKLEVGLARVSPIAENLGVSLETTVGVFGKLVDTGLSASRSGTVLVNTFKGLSTFTPKSEKAIARLGLTVQDVNLQFTSLDNALERLASTNYTDSDLQDIFGTRGKLISGILRNLEEGKKLQDLVDDITGTGGKEVFSDAQIDSLNQAVVRMNNSMTELRHTVVDLTQGTIIATLDAISDYAERITGMIDSINKLTGEGKYAEATDEFLKNAVNRIGFRYTDADGETKGLGNVISTLTRPLSKLIDTVASQQNTRDANAEAVEQARRDEIEARRGSGVSSVQDRELQEQLAIQKSIEQDLKTRTKVLSESELQNLAISEAQSRITKAEKGVDAIFDKRAREIADTVKDDEAYAIAITKLNEERKIAKAREVRNLRGITADELSLTGQDVQNNTRQQGDLLELVNNVLLGEGAKRSATLSPSNRGENVDKIYRSVLANVTDAQKSLKANLTGIDDFYTTLKDLTQLNPEIFTGSFDEFVNGIPAIYENLLGLNDPKIVEETMGNLSKVYDLSQDPKIASLIANRSEEASTLLFEQIFSEDGMEGIYGLFEDYKDFALAQAQGVSPEYQARIQQQINSTESMIVGKLVGFQRLFTEANFLDDSEITKIFNDIQSDSEKLPSTLEKIGLIISNLVQTGEQFGTGDITSQLSANERQVLDASGLDLQALLEDILSEEAFDGAITPKTTSDIMKYLFGNKKVVQATADGVEEMITASAEALDNLLKRSDLTPEQRKLAEDMKELNDSNAILSLNENLTNLATVTQETVSTMEKMTVLGGQLGGLLSQIGNVGGSDYLSNLGGALSGASKSFKGLSELGGLDFSGGLNLDNIGSTIDVASAGVQFGSFANSLLGQEDNITSTILSGLGSVGGYVIGGGIGSAIGGALGGAVGGLFGGSDKNKGIEKQRRLQQAQEQSIKDFQKAVDSFVDAINESGIEQAFENLASISGAETDVDTIQGLLSGGKLNRDTIDKDVIRQLLPQLNDTEISDLIRSTLGGFEDKGYGFSTGQGKRGGFNTGAFAQEIARLNEEMGDALTENLVNSLDIATDKFKDVFGESLLTGSSVKNNMESIISNAYQNAITNTGTVVAFSDKLQKLLIGDIEDVITDEDYGFGLEVPEFETIEEALQFMQEYSDLSNKALDEIIDKYDLVGLKIDKINAELEEGSLRLYAEGSGAIEQQRFELQKLQEQQAYLTEGTKEWYELLGKIKDAEEELYDVGVKIARNQEDVTDIRNLVTSYQAQAIALERLYDDIAIARERNDLEAVSELEKQIAQLETEKAQGIKNSLSSAVYNGLAEGFMTSGSIDMDDLGDEIRKQVYTAQMDSIIESILNSAEINEAINSLTKSVEDGATDEAESILDGLLDLIDGSLEGFEDQIAKIEEILGADSNTDPIVFFDEQNLDDTLKAIDTVGEGEITGQNLDEKILKVQITKEGGDLSDEEMSKIAELVAQYGLEVDTSNTI